MMKKESDVNMKKAFFFVIFMFLLVIPIKTINAEENINSGTCRYDLSNIVSYGSGLQIQYEKDNNFLDISLYGSAHSYDANYSKLTSNDDINELVEFGYNIREDLITQNTIFTYNSSENEYYCNDIFYQIKKLDRSSGEKDQLYFDLSFSEGIYPNKLVSNYSFASYPKASDSSESEEPIVQKPLITIEACNNPSFLKGIYIVKVIIRIVTILVPIILIVTIMIELFKTVIGGTEKITVKPYLNKIFLAIGVFLVPTIISLILELIGGVSAYESCYKNATKHNIEYLERLEES